MAAKKTKRFQPINYNVARRVRRALKRLGLSQRELAALSGVSRSSVDHSARGHGKAVPPLVELTIRALDFQNLEHAGDAYLQELDEPERIAATFEFGARSELFKQAVYGEIARLAGKHLEEAA